MFDAALSTTQLIVIDALSEGVNMTDAAAQAGVHRNTLANWRRNSLFFREALADAQYDRALLFRDKTEDRLDRALETIDAVLTDPKASASARLKAALYIIEKATTPPAPRKQVPFDIPQIHVSHPTVHPAPAPAPEQPAPENPPSVHNSAQNAQSPAAAPAAETNAPPENPPAMHNFAQNAQTPFRRETPKVGRNEPCPCGSGQKHKRCCLGKANLTMAA